MHDLAGHCHKLFQACARNDDRIAATMCFLSDAHKAASFVFPEFNVEMLPFDLEFLCDDYVIHDALEGFAEPYVVLPAAIEGRLLLNDTKAYSGKPINFRPQALICNFSSLFLHETEVDLLPEGVDPHHSHNDPIANNKTHLASAPGDSLAPRIKNEKVVIKRRNPDHAYLERIFDFHQQPVIPHVNDRPLQAMRFPEETGKIFHLFQTNRFPLRVRRDAFRS
jgi:hypothetical protein